MNERSLWNESEVEVTSSGFLWVKNPDIIEDEDQPCLLQSTARLLSGLYPSLKLEEILTRPGFRPEIVTKYDQLCRAMSNLSLEGSSDKTDTKESNLADVYQCYQGLLRIENVATWIGVALSDIQTFKQREGPKKPRITRQHMQLIALEKQQQRLKQVSSERSLSTGTGETDAENQGAADTENDKPDDQESQNIRMIRVINSIRALYPHLLPILNHPLRNDKNLVIRTTCYKPRKRGAMSWLIGTVGFDTCTAKAVGLSHSDATTILENFIDVEVARKIVEDPLGSPEFWTVSWIKELKTHCNPVILNPLELLSTKLGKPRSYIASEGRKHDSLIQHGSTSKDMELSYGKSVSKLHRRLSNLLTTRFNGARLSIYGSCLSNLSLGKGSDVDLSLWIPEAERLKTSFADGSIAPEFYQRNMKKMVYQAFDRLNYLKSEFRNMVPITHARIPVITGTYIYADNPYSDDGSIDFDICFLNDIAVANSSLLREYSLVDNRVRELMMTVKKWAKEFGINSAKDRYISSYTWVNLVIFYLQCISLVPNLQSLTLMTEVGITPDPENNYWHSVNKLNTCSLTWDALRRAGVWVMPAELEEIPVSALLYGFFEFYGFRHPWMFTVSIKHGEIGALRLNSPKRSCFFSVEDPFETYDSHIRHDLGAPTSENGSAYIMQCLRAAESYLLKVFSGNINGGRLWPDCSLKNPVPIPEKDRPQQSVAPTKENAIGDEEKAKVPNGRKESEAPAGKPRPMQETSMQAKSGTNSDATRQDVNERPLHNHRPNKGSENPFPNNQRRPNQNGHNRATRKVLDRNHQKASKENGAKTEGDRGVGPEGPIKQRPKYRRRGGRGRGGRGHDHLPRSAANNI